MSADFNYAHYYARQSGSKQHTASQRQRPGAASQFHTQPFPDYSPEQYTDQYAGPVRQDTPLWDNRRSVSRATPYNDAAHNTYAAPQPSIHSYQGSHDGSNSAEFASIGSASFGHRQGTAPLASRNDIVRQGSTHTPNYYQQSQSQYSRSLQQHTQSPHQQSNHTTSDYNLAQHDQVRRHPASANLSRSVDPGVESRPTSPAFLATKQSDVAATQPQQQYHRSAAQHGRRVSNEAPPTHQKLQPAHESVPANMSAPRVSATAEQGHSSTTVDPSQVYDPYHEYKRQVARRAEAKKADEAKDKAEEERLIKEKENAEVAADAQQTNTRSQTGPNDKRHKTAAKQSVKPSNTADDMSAAMTLLQASNANSANATQSEKDELQAQMLEMFKKMREFNEKDPDMLSRLWQQERDQHLAKSSQASPSAAEPTNNNSPPATAREKKKRGPNSGRRAASNTTGPRASKSTVAPDALPAPVANVAAPTQNEELTATRNPQKGSATERPTSTRTIWPSDKKGALAQTAVDFIKGNPDNHHMDISASDVSAILDTNPNYVELCLAIEKRGLKLDRSTFAKHLLRSVPGPRSATAQGGAGQASSAQTAAVAPPVAEVEARLQSGESLLPSPKSKKTGRSRNDNAATQPSVGSESQTQLASARTNNTPQSSAAIDPELEGLDAVKAFVDDQGRPVFFSSKTKQKAAKKAARQRHEASVSVTPGPQSKEELARKRTFGDLVDLTLISESEEDVDVFYPAAKRQDLEPQDDLDSTAQASASKTAEDDADGSRKIAPTVPNIDWEGLAPRPTAVPDIAALMKPAQPLPSGPIVSQPPVPPRPTLNGSITPKAARTVPHASNASVFIPPNHPARKAILALPLDKSKAFRRSTYDARTIARDVLLACGRHPDMRHLNAHLEHLKQAFPSLADNNADLSTINWDVIDPGGPPAGWGTRVQPEPPIDVGSDADTEDNDAEDIHTGNNRMRHITKTARLGSGRQENGQGVDSLPRPRGSKRFRQSMPGSGTPATRLSKPTSTPSSAPPAGASSYTALRPVDENGNPIKKKGRPVGWRKWMQKGGDGAPGKAHGVAKSKKPEPEPVYQVYKCEWRNCRAELHNLETLRRHIHKVHGKRADEDGLWHCHWSSCGLSEQFVDQSTSRTTSRFCAYSFAELDKWKSHIERTHLEPIAWKLGDGPAGGISDRDSELSEAYMSDRQGRRVTPQIALPEDDAAASRAMLKSFKRTAEEEAQLELANAERRKRDTGPGVDKGGARLANEKRRQGLIDDSSDAQIIDDDE